VGTQTEIMNPPIRKVDDPAGDNGCLPDFYGISDSAAAAGINELRVMKKSNFDVFIKKVKIQA